MCTETSTILQHIQLLWPHVLQTLVRRATLLDAKLGLQVLSARLSLRACQRQVEEMGDH